MASLSIPATPTVRDRLRLFFTFRDARFEDITPETWRKVLLRDLSAGLVVALTAIPMAMGFAIAMGLRPEQGIVAGAVACLVGRTFGGSKYQVYGPTAAFIPVIAGIMAKYGEANGGSFAQAHGFLVLASIVAGVVLMGLGVLGLGRYAKLVPNSVVVGFTVGIAVTIAVANLGEVLGFSAPLTGNLAKKLTTAAGQIGEVNGYAILLALGTFALTKILQRVSIFLPAPFLAIGAATLAAKMFLPAGAVASVRDRFGAIPTNFFLFTPPSLPAATPSVFLDLAYFVVAIAFVSGVESLLCSSMADRLANNKGTPFHPDKEFWGQGLVQIITPLLNGFPCTGALARTATSIKAGAVSPFAGYFKAVLKIALAVFLARWLEIVPMACIGGILVWVASNMIKPAEVREVVREGKLPAAMLVYTAVAVPMTDFLTGVLSALILYVIASRLLRKATPVPARDEATAEE